MSDFTAIIDQIRFRLGLRHRPHWGCLQRSPYVPFIWWEGLAVSPPKLHPAVDPSSLDIRSFGP